MADKKELATLPFDPDLEFIEFRVGWRGDRPKKTSKKERANGTAVFRINVAMLDYIMGEVEL